MMRELRDISSMVVRSLSPRERTVIVLLYAERLRVRDVSRVLDMSPARVVAIAASVRRRVQEAMRQNIGGRAVALWMTPVAPDRSGDRRRQSQRRRMMLPRPRVPSPRRHRLRMR
jgi:hypothetical protein